MRRTLAIVLVAALAVAAGACGHRSVDRAGFVRQANAICRDVAKRFGRLIVQEERPAAFYREARRINAEGAALLRGILAPEEIRPSIRALAQRIDAAARLFDRAARLALDGEPTDDVEAAIERAGKDFARRARALGLTSCGSAPSPSPSPRRSR